MWWSSQSHIYLCHLICGSPAIHDCIYSNRRLEQDEEAHRHQVRWNSACYRLQIKTRLFSHVHEGNAVTRISIVLRAWVISLRRGDTFLMLFTPFQWRHIRRTGQFPPRKKRRGNPKLGPVLQGVFHCLPTRRALFLCHETVDVWLPFHVPF